MNCTECDKKIDDYRYHLGYKECVDCSDTVPMPNLVWTRPRTTQTQEEQQSDSSPESTVTSCFFAITCGKLLNSLNLPYHVTEGMTHISNLASTGVSVGTSNSAIGGSEIKDGSAVEVQHNSAVSSTNSGTDDGADFPDTTTASLPTNPINSP